MIRNLFGCISVAALAGLLSVGCSENATQQPTETDSGQKTPEATSVEGIRIISVEPELAEIGGLITITGQGFGNRQEHSVSIGGNGINVELEVVEWQENEELVEWQENKIVVKIPDDPRIQQNLSYYYRVQSNDYKKSSNLYQFSFK